MFDLLLVNPNNRIISPHAGIEPPLWAGLIASDYRSKGQKVAILDAEAEDLTIEETVKYINKHKAKRVIIVVMGNNPSASSTPKMKITKELCQRLEKHCVAVTGLHPSALPKETYEELRVPVLTGRMFDGTPDIPWDLLPMDRYQAHNWHCLDGSPRNPYASIYTSLGCPFDCSFCNIHALYGGSHKVWYRDPKAVVAEIELLANKYNIRNIKFWDELFTLNERHVLDICQRLSRKNLDLNIWAYARVDTVTPDSLALMKNASINWLAYGYESGTDNTLNTINKRANKAQAIEVTKTTHEAGINIIGNFIFGLPDENPEETLEFAKSLKLEYANFYVVKPYPGSKLEVKNKNWATYGQYHRFAKTKAEKFRDYAITNFFSDKAYLNRIEKKFGTQAIDHINSFLAFGRPTTRGA